MRKISVVLVLIGGLGVLGSALEYFPLQVVFVRPGTPTPVILAVGTPEELAPLTFTFLETPKHGVLLGFPRTCVHP